MTDKEDKEKFIDILMVVMGLVLAGASDLQNKGFYYAIFVFLTFAISIRVLLILKENCRSINNKTLNSIIFLSSIPMAITFPLVFSFFFYVKLIPGGEVKIWTISFLSFAAITAAVSTLIYILFTNFFVEEYAFPKITRIKELCMLLCKNKLFRLWLLFFIGIFSLDIILLAIIPFLKENTTQSSDYLIQNASVIIDNATVTIVNATI